MRRAWPDAESNSGFRHCDGDLAAHQCGDMGFDRLLQSLQVKQQLGTQALTIANNNSALLLQLFRYIASAAGASASSSGCSALLCSW